LWGSPRPVAGRATLTSRPGLAFVAVYNMTVSESDALKLYELTPEKAKELAILQ